MKHGKTEQAVCIGQLFVIVTPYSEALFRYAIIDPGGEFYPRKRSEFWHQTPLDVYDGLQTSLRRTRLIPVWCHNRRDCVVVTFSVTWADQASVGKTYVKVYRIWKAAKTVYVISNRCLNMTIIWGTTIYLLGSLMHGEISIVHRQTGQDYLQRIFYLQIQQNMYISVHKAILTLCVIRKIRKITWSSSKNAQDILPVLTKRHHSS